MSNYLKANIHTSSFETVLSNIDTILSNLLGENGLQILQEAYLERNEAEGKASQAVNGELSRLDLSTQETVSNLLAIQEVIRQYKEIATGVANGSRIRLTDQLINVDIEELYKVVNGPGGIEDLLNKNSLGKIISEPSELNSWIANYEATIKSGFRHQTLDENGSVGYVANKQEDMDRERIFKTNKGKLDNAHDDVDRKLATAYATSTVLEELVDIMHGDLRKLEDIFDHFHLDAQDDINSQLILADETLGGEKVYTGPLEGFLQANMNLLMWLKDSSYNLVNPDTWGDTLNEFFGGILYTINPMHWDDIIKGINEEISKSVEEHGWGYTAGSMVGIIAIAYFTGVAADEALGASGINNKLNKYKAGAIHTLDEFNEKYPNFESEIKPKGANIAEKWYNKGGEIYIDESGITHYVKDVEGRHYDVPYTENGPDFSEYYYNDMDPISYYDVKEVTGKELTGNQLKDTAIMNEYYKKVMGVNPPKGYTWHHEIDGSMTLVPTEIHGPIAHTGGASGYRNGDLPK